MIRLKEKKEHTEHASIKSAAIPQKLIIPLSQHFGAECIPKVNVGDIVATGQLIASLDKGLFSPIHSSVSGKIASIGSFPHPSLGSSSAIVIENDSQDTKLPSQRQEPLNQADVDKISIEELKKIICDTGIVGLGGATFPTHVKLSPPKPVQHLIVNGVECEPCLTTDYRLMVEKPNEIIKGMEIALKILGLEKGIIAIEDNKPEAIKIFRDILKDTKHEVRALKTCYPQGGEKQVIQSVLKQEVPSGDLPFDVGVIVQNVGTMYAVYEAVYKSKPLYERVVTLTGSCLENPGNFLVRIGTTVRDLLNECGPLKKEPAKIIFGGPMMGIAQATIDVPIIKSTSGIVFYSKEELNPKEGRPCCRCGRCVDECPVRIMPSHICMAAEKERFDLAEYYDISDCIECGLCSYVCPAQRDLVGLIKYAKTRLKNK
ncbi:electron transport complex subunit RsxC [Candidatus Omnitrophota bacterium]